MCSCHGNFGLLFEEEVLVIKVHFKRIFFFFFFVKKVCWSNLNYVKKHLMNA